MNLTLLKIQTAITKAFLWTSPIALIILLLSNFPALEKSLWNTEVIAPLFAISFVIWFFSFLFVIVLTFISAKFKEEIIQDVVLNKERDERESLISGIAAKKSILITLAAGIFILLCTTGQYNKFDTNEKSSLTIGHFHLIDSAATTTQNEDGTTIIHYQLPMSKMSLVLLLILIQLSSFHAFKIINLKKMEL